MSNLIDEYKQLVPFLGRSLGENYEIVLQDCREGTEGVIAIANNHISGRKIGSPLTDYATEIIQNGIWKERSCVVNYLSTARFYKSLRSSTYFIKESDKLLGMLCINVDTSKYQQLSDEIMRLGGFYLLDDQYNSSERNVQEGLYGSFMDLLQESVEESFHGQDVDLGNLKQNEKVALLESLSMRGAFLLKGAVSKAAEALNCSEATIYRYLSIINKKGTKE